MTSNTPSDIFADERSRVIDLAQYVYDRAKADSERYQRQEEAAEVARRLYRGDYHVTENRVASETNPMGLDPALLPMCALRCGDAWYAGGRVVGFWNRSGGYQAVHMACWRFAVTLGVPPRGAA